MTRVLVRLGVASGLLAATASMARAEDAVKREEGLRREAPWEGFNLYVDQDVFFAPAFDQDYTMGIEFVCAGSWVRQRHLSAPLGWLDHLTGASRLHAALVEDDVAPNERPKARGFASSLHSIHFGDTAFTPLKADLGETAPLYDDRPYANLLYLKVRRTSARRRSALVTDLTFGVLGLNVGKWVQTQIHKSNGDVKPGGWGNQISNGGEPTLKYRVSPRVLLATSASDVDRPAFQPTVASEAAAPTLPPRLFRADLAVSTEVNLGYYTNASAGGRFRLGFIRSPWWSFERNAIADVRGSSSSRGVFAGGNPLVQELFVFGSAGATGWAYNALLQGQFRHSNVTLGTDSEAPAPMRRLTSDAQVGATVRVRPGVSVTYAVQWLSPTFGGPKERTHSWGSLYISYQK